MARRGRGRPLRLTQVVHDTIIKHLKVGAFRRHAAEAAGVSEDAVNSWLTRGAAGEKAYVTFYEDVRKVQAEDAIRSQSVITRAQLAHIDGDWKAAAWNLERKYPKLYGAQAGPHVGVTIDSAGGDDNGTRTKVEFYLPDNGRRPAALEGEEGGEEA